MSLPQQEQREQTLYRMDSNMMHAFKSVQDQIADLSKHHVHKYVRVETTDGDVFEGRLIHCERGILYLELPSHGISRGFAPGFQNNVILPLVLYNLLVISLI